MSSSREAQSRRTSVQKVAESGTLTLAEPSSPMTTRIGRLVEQTGNGTCMVDYQGNVRGPMPARVVATCLEPLSRMRARRPEVLLVFDAGDATAPVIVGIVSPVPASVVQVISIGGRPAQVSIEGEALVMRAERTIRIECGESSLALHADGTVIVKGRRILSRASESNRVKGATVSIN